ncbi:MAG: CsgG/HfaB family protein [Planctomycetota bacterium]
MKMLVSVLIFLASAVVATPVEAQTTRPASNGVTVAVFAFEASGPSGSETGGQVAEVVAALLSAEPSLRLVDRVSLDRIVDELELGASGLAGDRAAEAGRLVGAELLVVGRVFQMDDTAYLSARVIGTETSLVKPVLVERPADRAGPPLGELAREAAKSIAALVRDESSALLAKPAVDPLPALIERVRDQITEESPSVFVRIPEQHFGSAVGRDPAAQTELVSILRSAGFTIASTADDADYVVEGEAFSELGTRLADLVSCSARVEISIVDRTGRNLLADRAVARAADLGEQIAGKTALERAARHVSIDLLKTLAELANAQ